MLCFALRCRAFQVQKDKERMVRDYIGKALKRDSWGERASERASVLVTSGGRGEPLTGCYKLQRNRKEKEGCRCLEGRSCSHDAHEHSYVLTMSEATDSCQDVVHTLPGTNLARSLLEPLWRLSKHGSCSYSQYSVVFLALPVSEIAHSSLRCCIMRLHF